MRTAGRLVHGRLAVQESSREGSTEAQEPGGDHDVLGVVSPCSGMGSYSPCGRARCQEVQVDDIWLLEPR